MPNPQGPDCTDPDPLTSISADVHVDVAAYVLGSLEPEDAEAYEWHLLGCSRCNRDMLDFSRLLPQLDVLDDELAGPLQLPVASPPEPGTAPGTVL